MWEKSSWLWRHMLFVVHDEAVFPTKKIFLYVFFMGVSFLFYGYFVILWELIALSNHIVFKILFK